MPWVVKRRWWVLAGGFVLLVVGNLPPVPGTGVRSLLDGLGFFLVFWAMLGVLLSIPIALRAHREAPRPHDPN
jgi:hypothetical protein